MTAMNWEISPRTGRCAKTDRVFDPGDEFYSVILPEGDGYRRLDVSTAAWAGPPEGTICYFRGRVPQKSGSSKGHGLNLQLLLEMFDRIESNSESSTNRIRFILSLILLRKRLLKLLGSETKDGAEYWILATSNGDVVHRVLNPQLTTDQAQDLALSISALLSSHYASEAEPGVAKLSSIEMIGQTANGSGLRVE